MSDSIKKLFIDAIRPEDIDLFINVFNTYYGMLELEEMSILENICQNPILYSGPMLIKYWHDNQYSKDVIDSLLKTGRGLIICSNQIAWNISASINKDDPFPAPKLDPNITNEELARKCWAPMKVKTNQISNEDFEIKTQNYIEKEIESLKNENIILRKEIDNLDNHNTNLIEMNIDIENKFNIVLQDNKRFKNIIKDLEIRFKTEKQKLVNEKNDYYNDYLQTQKLYQDAVDYIHKLEKSIM